MSVLSVIPPLSQAYAARVNVPFADTTSTINVTKSFMHALYTLLTNQAAGGTATGTRSGAQLFTVLSSTDGVTYSAADNIGGTFNATKWKMAVAPTTHAHIVLTNGEIDVLIDAGSVTAGQLRISMTPSAFPFTGGATTTGPTAPREIQARNHAPNAGSSPNIMGETTIGSTHLAHLCIGADGSFHFFTTRAGGGGANFYLSVTKCNDSQAGDPYPWVLTTWSGPATINSPTRPNWTDSGANLEFRLSDGALFLGTGGLSQLQFGGNSWDAQPADMINGLPQVYEVEVLALGPSTLRKGTLRDTLSIGSRSPMGAGYPLAGATQLRMVLGGILIPLPALTPTF